MTILDKEQGLDDLIGDIEKIVVHPLGVDHLVHRLALGTENLHASLTFLVIGDIKAHLRIVAQTFIESGLPADHHAFLLQFVDQMRDLDIAKTIIVGAFLGENDGIAGPVGQPITQFGGISTDQFCLQDGRLTLEIAKGDQCTSKYKQQHHQPRPDPDGFLGLFRGARRSNRGTFFIVANAPDGGIYGNICRLPGTVFFRSPTSWPEIGCAVTNFSAADGWAIIDIQCSSFIKVSISSRAQFPQSGTTMPSMVRNSLHKKETTIFQEVVGCDEMMESIAILYNISAIVNICKNLLVAPACQE